MEWMTLIAKLTLDDSDFTQKLDDNEKKASGWGSTIKSAAGGIASGVAAIGAAGAAAATAVGAIAKSAVDGYADSQQLVGGIETLFGKDNLGKVLENANNAYKTAGMSANEYMETSIQSAAALINSLGNDQKKATELMDMSIIDMSDNVNKMGTSMEGVQNAYRGFSRGNFTMLDNLALGYSGTKEGMQELLTKAEELEAQQGRSTKYSIDNYADIVQAIHVVQTEMGITGTTSAEADKTISGSLASMKTAWQNLINGLADPNADMGQLIGNMVEAAKTALKNILPAFKQAVKGIGSLIKEIAPVLAKELPEIINSVLPEVISAASSLLQGLVSALPDIIKILTDAIPMLLNQIIPAILEQLPAIIQAATKILISVVNAIITNLPMIVNAGIQAILEFQKGLAEALPELIPTVVDAILTIVETLLDNIDLLIDAGLQLTIGIAEGLINALPRIIEKIPVIIEKIVSALINSIPKIAEAGVKLFVAIVKNLPQIISSIVSAVPKIITGIVNAFKSGISKMKEVGANLLSGLWEGIKSKAQGVIDGVKGIGSKIVNGIMGVFGEHSPSKVFHKIGGYLMEGLANGISDSTGLVNKAMDALDTSVELSANQMHVDAPEYDGQIFTVPRTQEARQLNVILELDRMQFARAVYTMNDEETQRVGMRLAGGIA